MKFTNFINTPHVQEIEPTTPTEVLSYVQRLKPRKSPGLDQISNRMIKNLPLKFLLFFTLLINQLFKNNYFPNSWKTAVVIPILKPEKDSALPSNYRPISLLSCLSKVYEFVLLQRLNQHCTASNFIIPQQCGFRPKCSTVHQLLRVTELIHSGFAKHEKAAVAEWYRYRTVACFVTGSSPVPLKTRRVGQRCTLNLSRAETSSRWCGVVVRRGGVPAQVMSTSLDHGSKLRGPSPKALV
ncbi:RNA-directed DNA polymerase from mobile element jockey [Trichonephila clavipes]|uniref:RNA-directed DNA polymerase from mobile element jockey n=1 Tax=Trichonephila clavipes TaxID=2585209 RepID=A0A8X6S9F6_TRICX|nr:RNA-directed DNA polymerase from mobile element jockey [Trichonephila clavipes]